MSRQTIESGKCFQLGERGSCVRELRIENKENTRELLIEVVDKNMRRSRVTLHYGCFASLRFSFSPQSMSIATNVVAMVQTAATTTTTTDQQNDTSEVNG